MISVSVCVVWRIDLTKQRNHVVARSTVNEGFVERLNIHRSENYEEQTVNGLVTGGYYHNNVPIGIAAEAITISTSGICW